MASDNEQQAIVQELLKRRDSLDPEKQAIVDELGKRFSLPPPAMNKIPIPEGLQPQSYGARVLSNLPSSIANFVKNAPLAPSAGPRPVKDEKGNWVYPPISLSGELGGILSGIGNTVFHPEESFAQDPVGTVALPAMAAYGGFRSPAIQGAVREGAAGAMNAPRRFPVASTAAGSALGAAMAHMMGLPFWEGNIAGAALPAVVGGAKGAVKGFREAPLLPGGISWPGAPMPTPPRQPLWVNIETGEVSPAPAPSTPSAPPTQTPSGRKPGSLATQQPPTKPTPPPGLTMFEGTKGSIPTDVKPPNVQGEVMPPAPEGTLQSLKPTAPPPRPTAPPEPPVAGAHMKDVHPHYVDEPNPRAAQKLDEDVIRYIKINNPGIQPGDVTIEQIQNARKSLPGKHRALDAKDVKRRMEHLRQTWNLQKE